MMGLFFPEIVTSLTALLADRPISIQCSPQNCTINPSAVGSQPLPGLVESSEACSSGVVPRKTAVGNHRLPVGDETI